jgi:hypothetical protein
MAAKPGLAGGFGCFCGGMAPPTRGPSNGNDCCPLGTWQSDFTIGRRRNRVTVSPQFSPIGHPTSFGDAVFQPGNEIRNIR